MSLLQYWPTADEINNCIKHEAEGAHDAVLLAVHRPTPLSYKLVSSGERFTASEEELFEFLVSPDVPSGAHVIPITGASGVGKSHMVRILNAKLQSMNEDGRYVVIRIPKSASLRKVVELILEQIPGDEYTQVRSEFAKALTENIDLDTAAIRFQSQLDIALQQLTKELATKLSSNPGNSFVKTQLGHATELPKFFGDPVLVEHFRKNVFKRFVKRAVAGQIDNDQESIVKDFVPDDLIIPDEIDLSTAALSSKRYYLSTLQSRDAAGMKDAANLLNEYKVGDHAIRQLFNLHQSLGGMTLQEVILEIRRRLLTEKRELVIFVEDFKALTGIQDILLKVLIQEGVREGVPEFATMRSVIAVTDGYLDTEDTIATRAKREWKVESELSNPQEVLTRTKALVAAYLNAARWGFGELVRHFEKKQKDHHEQDRWIPPYIDPDGNADSSMLASFGYQEEIPLFPFTEPAIEQLARIALTRNNILVFTPRFVIDNVLRTILLQGRPAFERGEFPPSSIKVPGTNAEVAQWLGSLPVSAEIRGRYLRTISIWGNGPRTVKEVGYIPKQVFDAFKLNPPNIEFQKPPPKEANTVPTDTIDVLPPKQEDDSFLEALEKWVQGELLPQNFANQIRNAVAFALNERIDWDSERFIKNPLQRNDISIPNARGEGNIISHPIKISENNSDDSGNLRLELAAVVRFYQLNNGKINYDGADDDLVWVGNLVDRLLPQALSLIRTLINQRLTAVLRLLQLNSQLLGNTYRGMTPTSLAPCLFGEVNALANIPSDSKGTFIEWRALQEQALSIRPELIRIATSFCGSFQGTGKTVYAIDMVRVTNAIQDTENVQTAHILELSNELKPLLASMTESRVNLQVRKVLQEANTIRSKLITTLGEGFNKQEIVDELKGLTDQLGGAGAWPTSEIGMSMSAFKALCEEFRTVAIREALATLSSAGEEGNEQGNVNQLGWVGRLDFKPLIVADNFVETALKVINASEKQASALETKFKGVDPQSQISQIQELFLSLIQGLDSFTDKGEI